MTIDPAKQYGSELEAKAWLDTVVATYAQRSGISLSAAGAGGASGGGGGGATINSEEFLKFKAKQDNLLLNTLSYTCATSSMSLMPVTSPMTMRKLTQRNSRPNWIALPRHVH